MSNQHADVHADLAASVRTYAEREGGLARVRRLRDSGSGFDRAAWSKLGKLGWLGLLVPEARGGSGLGLAEMTVVARELGRALVPEPVTAAGVLAAHVLVLADTDPSRKILAGLMEGTLLPAVAWQDSVGDIDASRVSTEIVDAHDTRVLCGSKQLVAYGGDADGYLVSARSAGGIGIYWVERGSARVTYRSMRRADGSEHGVLEFDRAPMRAENCVIAPGAGEAVLTGAVDECLIAASSEPLGIAERALDITLEYLRTRTQFGKAIGSFQALQHRCVDMFIHKELGISALTAALSEWEHANAARRSALASRVKARCADAALDICRKAVQMHGAMGFTDDCDIGLYLKRALVLAAWLGNAQAHRRRYAKLALVGAAPAHAAQAPGRAA